MTGEKFMHYEKSLDKAYKLLSSEDYDEAFKELSRLEMLGIENSELWANLGWLHQAGSGAALDLDKAMHYYQKAANAGDELSDYYIASIYQSRNEMEKAISHYAKSAEKGHSSSCYWLGSIYMLGDGCERDKNKAEKYLRMGMDRGHLFAKRDIALADIRGTFGKRKILLGVYNYLMAILKGVYLAAKNTEDHRVR